MSAKIQKLHVQVTLDAEIIAEFKRIIRKKNYNNQAEFFREVIREIVNNE